MQGLMYGGARPGMSAGEGSSVGVAAPAKRPPRWDQTNGWSRQGLAYSGMIAPQTNWGKFHVGIGRGACPVEGEGSSKRGERKEERKPASGGQ